MKRTTLGPASLAWGAAVLLTFLPWGEVHASPDREAHASPNLEARVGELSGYALGLRRGHQPEGLPALLSGEPSGYDLGPRRGQQPEGFLFSRPRVSLGVRSGMFFHRAGSDLYDFSQERFTIDRSDFRGLSFGVEGAVWIGSRTELALGLDGSRLTLRSESRDWLEEDGSPIRQATRLTHGPAVSLGARYYLRDRGEELGRFVWIPAGWNAFIGGGGGVGGYRFEQWGDFVNEREETIFEDHVESEGSIFFPFLAAGLELGVSTRSALVLEGRYQWGQDDLGSDFTRFEPMDLAGARLSAGVSFRF